MSILNVIDYPPIINTSYSFCWIGDGEQSLHWLRKFGPTKGLVGIEMLANGMALAARNDMGCVTALGLFDSSPEHGAQHGVQQGAQQKAKPNEFLENFVAKYELESQQCNLVLPQGKYQLLLVEAPDVPDAELREAIRWRIKDLISISLDAAAIDIFLLPHDGVKAGKRMIYVVVAEKTLLREYITLVAEAGLELNSIDIGELALRNIALLKEEGKSGSRGIALARINQGAGNVSLYRNGNLYLSRSFKMNYQAGLLDELPVDSLMLEVQRSLDYYERQMGQSPPAALYVFGENVTKDKLSEEFSRGLTVDVKFLALEEEIVWSEAVQQDLLPPCLGALGATLRGAVSP